MCSILYRPSNDFMYSCDKLLSIPCREFVIFLSKLCFFEKILLDKAGGASYTIAKAMTKRDGIGCLQRVGGWCKPMTENSNVL